jgi:hypothetical protein
MHANQHLVFLDSSMLDFAFDRLGLVQMVEELVPFVAVFAVVADGQ